MLIEIEHGYEIAIGGDRATFLLRAVVEDFRIGACAIVRLIERTVSSAVCSSAGDVDLVFEEGQSLRILGGDDGFEGFHLGG